MDVDVVSEFLNRLPIKRKTTPSGWTSFNAVCCHHRGHSPDRRGRGGIKLANGGIVYHCFNCEFESVWQPGSKLSKHARTLLGYLGASQEEIARINFFAIKSEAQIQAGKIVKNTSDTAKILLPEGSKSFEEWAETPNENFEDVVKYLIKRNPKLLDWHDFYWSDSKKFMIGETPIYNMYKRVIIPFKHPNSDWIYGYSARAIDEDSSIKYITFSTPGYLFGQHHLYDKHRKYAIACEGIFDAISISGLAFMKQTMSKQQLETLRNSDKKIIIVPDRDKDGSRVIHQATKNKFSVSFPEWGRDIKDTADAVAKYGRLAALEQILEAKESDPFKIALKSKFWFKEVSEDIDE